MSIQNDFAAALKGMPLIAILRGITVAELPGVFQALAAVGIRLMEIPLNTPDALTVIREGSKLVQPGQLIGAGTVLHSYEVDAVQQAGGQFILAPNTDVTVIQETRKAGLVSIPGCFTATEALLAFSNGADYLKIFPAGRMSPDYIKDLKAVVPAQFIAVGAISAANLAAFLKVCVGAGIGNALYKPGKSLAQLQADCQAMTAVLGK